jgi:hypothetical protein
MIRGFARNGLRTSSQQYPQQYQTGHKNNGNGMERADQRGEAGVCTHVKEEMKRAEGGNKIKKLTKTKTKTKTKKKKKKRGKECTGGTHARIVQRQRQRQRQWQPPQYPPRSSRAFFLSQSMERADEVGGQEMGKRFLSVVVVSPVGPFLRCLGAECRNAGPSRTLLLICAQLTVLELEEVVYSSVVYTVHGQST